MRKNCYLLTFGLIAFAQHSTAAGPMYTITDLGTLGGSASAGFAINNLGQVAGYAFLSGDKAVQPFRWNGSAMQELPNLGPIISNFMLVPQGAGQAWGINTAGQVVGFSITTDPQTGLNTAHAVVWNGTTITDIGTGWGNYSIAKSINEAGQIAGFIGDTSTGIERPAIWNGTTVKDLGTLGGNGEAMGINKLGQATGTFSTSNGPRGFFFDGITLRDIGSGTTANSINDSGQITGRIDTTNTLHAYIWKDAFGLTDLGFPAGAVGAEGMGINNSGQVVGVSFVNFSSGLKHAFFFDGTVMWDLNNQVTDIGSWTELSGAQAINDAGQITGYGTIDGQQHAFLLTPVLDCQPPKILSTDDTGAAGLMTTSLSPPKTVSGKFTTTVTFENPSRFWLGVLDTSIDPPSKITYLPDLSAGAEGVAAAFGLITPCAAGLSGKPPFISCTEPGGGVWTAQFCSQGSISVQLGPTPLSAAVTLTDLLVPDSPPSLLAGLATNLQTVPAFATTAQCLTATTGTILGCVVNGLHALVSDPAQVARIAQIFNSAGLDLSVDQVTKLLLKGVSLDLIETLGDLTVFQIQTANAGHAGVLRTKIIGQ